MTRFDDAEPVASSPSWTIIYADMMSLLLTLFVMLASISEVREDHLFQAMLRSLRQQFGPESSAFRLLPESQQARGSALGALASMGRTRRAETLGSLPRVRVPAAGSAWPGESGLDALGDEARTQRPSELPVPLSSPNTERMRGSGGL